MIRVSDVIGYHPAPFLVKWQEKKGWAFCENVREEALAVGTAVDQMVQDSINGGGKAGVVSLDLKKELHPQMDNCLKAWNNFCQSDEGSIFVEKAVKHKANMQKELIMGDLMGHPDFIFDDELPDLKTSKSISMSHWMQVAQYAKMKNAQVKPPNPAYYKGLIRKISILRLDKYDERGVWEYKVLWEPFITMLQERFDLRYQAMKLSIADRQDTGKFMCDEDEKLFADLMRKKLSKEILG